MRALVQRVTTAAVAVDGVEVARITPPNGGHGLLVLIGVTHDDDAAKATTLARKVWTMRILEDEKSAADLNAPLLVVSQFTLMADTRKSRRPSWSAAAPRPVAEPLIDEFTSALRTLGAHVESGVFGAHMEVSLVNDGPVTLLVEV
ncbi:D-tyrosyl-tRNA(Tyr) deacylase [Rhodococcus sp. SMB37]|uniref:D-aminoacyl-tRNA deacylase n=1 Tax=Rhodococcus sp. SMB37 TaxID=2512213 RepID=UPI0010522CCE|nr:D-aminoacyl-tRNA deacylase [Rhodococcus sp. SMB37]TCN57308.1 D-tyrosyl-tRNA(Tyr) deacylase [Rhodococcus sp. SMB37]